MSRQEVMLHGAKKRYVDQFISRRVDQRISHADPEMPYEISTVRYEGGGTSSGVEIDVSLDSLNIVGINVREVYPKPGKKAIAAKTGGWKLAKDIELFHFSSKLDKRGNLVSLLGDSIYATLISPSKETVCLLRYTTDPVDRRIVNLIEPQIYSPEQYTFLRASPDDLSRVKPTIESFGFPPKVNWLDTFMTIMTGETHFEGKTTEEELTAALITRRPLIPAVSVNKTPGSISIGRFHNFLLGSREK